MCETFGATSGGLLCVQQVKRPLSCWLLAWDCERVTPYVRYKFEVIIFVLRGYTFCTWTCGTHINICSYTVSVVLELYLWTCSHAATRPPSGRPIAAWLLFGMNLLMNLWNYSFIIDTSRLRPDNPAHFVNWGAHQSMMETNKLIILIIKPTLFLCFGSWL